MFNEQVDKNNLTNSKINNHEISAAKYGCSHTPVSMVPERDTGPGKISTAPVNTMGSLRFPSCHNSGQNSSKFKNEMNGNDEHRVLAGRQHHHVSVQELRMQVMFILN